jgi:hypothetical protein
MDFSIFYALFVDIEYLIIVYSYFVNDPLATGCGCKQAKTESVNVLKTNLFNLNNNIEDKLLWRAQK